MLRPFSWESLAGGIQPGDLLLYVDPARVLPESRRAGTALWAALESLLATLPLGSGAAERSDWNAVALLSVHKRIPHIVTYACVDEATHSSAFCFLRASDYLTERGVSRFAIRPLLAPGVRAGAQGLYTTIALHVQSLNDPHSASRRSVAAAQTDDVALVAELVGLLMGARLEDEIDLAKRRTVAQLFATGGALDDALAATASRFQLLPEICGRL